MNVGRSVLGEGIGQHLIQNWQTRENLHKLAASAIKHLSKPFERDALKHFSRAWTWREAQE
jgi:hypothetical protein